MTSKIVVNNIESDSGISSVTFTSDIELGTKNLKGHNLESTGIITATTFSGSGASLTNIPDSALSAVTASKLTGALPAISAANLTNLPAANLTGTLPAISGANLTGIAGGLTQADQWRVSSNFNLTAQTDTYITSNWERVDSNGYGLLGSGMSESSGEFTFPATGIYLVHLHLEAYFPSNTNPRLMARIYVTVGGGSYSFVANGNSHANSGGYYGGSDAFYLFDVTNTSTHKPKFLLYSSGTSNVITIVGDSSTNKTYASFIRLADT